MKVLLLLPIASMVCATAHAVTNIDPLSVLSKDLQQHERNPEHRPEFQVHHKLKYRQSLSQRAFTLHHRERFLQNGTAESSRCDSLMSEKLFENSTCTCKEGKFQRHS